MTREMNIHRQPVIQINLGGAEQGGGGGGGGGWEESKESISTLSTSWVSPKLSRKLCTKY